MALQEKETENRPLSPRLSRFFLRQGFPFLIHFRSLGVEIVGLGDLAALVGEFKETENRPLSPCSRALELPYTLLGFVSCDAMPGQRDLSFTWEYLCESPDGNPVLIREEYNVSTETTSPSGIKRKHLGSIEAEILTTAKYNQIRKHYMPSEERKVYLPISLLPEMKDAAFFSRLYDFSH